MSTFKVNVAKEIAANRGKPFGPFYLHHFLAILPATTVEGAKAQAKEISLAFPTPAFKVTLSRETSYGEILDFEARDED